MFEATNFVRINNNNYGLVGKTSPPKDIDRTYPHCYGCGYKIKGRVYLLRDENLVNSSFEYFYHEACASSALVSLDKKAGHVRCGYESLNNDFFAKHAHKRSVSRHRLSVSLMLLFGFFIIFRMFALPFTNDVVEQVARGFAILAAISMIYLAGYSVKFFPKKYSLHDKTKSRFG